MIVCHVMQLYQLFNFNSFQYYSSDLLPLEERTMIHIVICIIINLWLESTTSDLFLLFGFLLMKQLQRTISFVGWQINN